MHVSHPESTRRWLIDPVRKTHLPAVDAEITASVAVIAQLATKASSQPYYKWNTNWSHTVQDAVRTPVPVAVPSAR
jgi:hypothetical protein